MKKITMIIGLVVGLTMTMTDIAGADNFFSLTLNGDRNNYTGRVGYTFIPDHNIVVDGLGRAISQPVTQDHVIQLFRVSNSQLLASATVTSSTTRDNTGCPMEYLDQTVTLLDGVEYMILSMEYSSGDLWNTDRYVTGLYNTSIATITGDTYGGNPNDSMPPAYHGFGNNAILGPPTFSVYVKPPAASNLFNQTIAGNRNDYTGRVGYTFIPDYNIVVDGLGRGVTQNLNFV